MYWVLRNEMGHEYGRFTDLRDLMEYLRTMDTTELYEDEVELTLTMED